MEHFIDTFLNIVKKHGEKPAVSDETGTFTYQELWEYSCTVAANLRVKGAARGNRIIVEAPRSKEYAGCLLGCWFIGAAAIPLSDDYPEERLQYIKNDAQCEISVDAAFLRNMDLSLTMEPVEPDLSDEGVVIYTSGSTGNPKGVIHDFYSIAAVVARNIARDEAEDTETNNIAGLVAPFTFIVGMSLFLSAMAMGKHLVLVSDEVRRDPYKLAAYYDENNVESSFVPPRMVDFMLKHNHSLKLISVGSERITNIYFDDHPVVVCGYGATETFGAILAFKIDQKYENTPIGKPVGEEKAYVLDESNREVETGELCISGFVAKGYLNREKETKKAFIPNPFKETDGFDRMFRTGDIVTRLPDGNLVFVERKDWMIKINGQRVEPGEVEGTILRIPGIREAAVKDFTAKNGITYLAAYYVADETVQPEDVKAFCKENLTSYMVPSFYLPMEALPVNPNGKLDRKNLPEPDPSQFKSEYAAPENKIEEAICKAVEEVLKCGNVGRNDDFFLLGGDSVKAMETVNLLEDLPLDTETFFRGRTPAEITRLLENGGESEIAFERTEKEAYPLTSSQMGIYFAYEKDPENLMYNNPLRIDLPKDADAARLIKAVETAVRNHKAYSLRIEVRGGYPSMIPMEESTFTVERRSTEDLEASLKEFVKPFDLTAGETIRACLYERGEQKVLALDAHHIVFDGTTLSVLLKEISKLYEGKEIFEERTSALDLSSYEKALRKTERYQKAEEYFDQKFAGLEISNDFPCDYEDHGEGTLGTVELDLTLPREKLLRFLKGNSVTENSLFLSAYAYVLAKYNGTDRAIVYAGENGRHTSMTFNTAGMLVKTLALPVDVTENRSIADYITGLQKDFRDSIENDCYPFSELSGKYGLQNDFSFVYQGSNFTSLRLSGEECPVVGLHNPDAMDKMTLMVFDRKDSYRLSFRYQSDLYKEGIIRAFAGAFAQAVQEFLEKETLFEVELLSPEEEKALDAFCGEVFDLEAKTVPEFFTDCVAKYPEHDFAVFKDRHVTYREGGEITDRIAGALRKWGLGRNDAVGILLERSEWLPLSVYGVAKAGCAYVPMDPTYPEERLHFMAENAGVRVVITSRALSEHLKEFGGEFLFIEEICDLPLEEYTPVEHDPDDTFALIYTSGTTGTPKAVMVTYGNTSAVSQINRQKFGLGPKTRCACHISFGFDPCMGDIVTVPSWGGTLYVIPEEMRTDLPALDAYITENKIDYFIITTQIGRQFALYTRSPYLKVLGMGGEALVPLETVGLSFQVYNLYGPTESTVYITSEEVRERTLRVPIGRVNENGQAYIVDKNLRRLPVGVPGELLVAGPQVAKGYLGLPEKTASVFIGNPYTDERALRKVYRTGDIARFLPDGRVDYIGRNDGQVKIRGFRIELTEVEEVIRRFPGVKDATVAAFKEPAGGKYLAAYVVSDEAVDVEALHAFIRAEKPPYMVPAVTMQINKIPLNQNQKVNKKALPVPARKVSEVTLPANETEQKIYDILVKELGHSEFGTDTDLFEAGLTSIGVIRLNVALEEAFGIPVKVSDIREQSTVKLLSAFFSGKEAGEEMEILPDYPVTKTQMGIYIECAANPGSVTYNIPMLLRLSPATDTAVLAAAIRKAIDAHPYLKAVLFADQEGNIRAERNDDRAAAVETVQCGQLPEASELVRPFTLLGEPLYRVTLYETRDGNYLFMDFHHIVMDGVSENLFLDTINRAYRGEAVRKERYTGFEAALAEEKARESELFEKAKAYYDGIFRGCDANCLPPKAPEHGAAGAGNVTRMAETLPGTVSRYCRQHKVTENAFFNAAFAETLSFFSHFDDAVYTTIYNGRSDSRLSASVTMLVKTLPMLLPVKGNRPVEELIRKAQDELVESMSYDIYSFAELSASYGIRSDILFVYQGSEFTFDTFCGQKAEFVKVMPDVAKAPLTVTVSEKDGAYLFNVDYERGMFNKALIESFLQVFDFVLRGFTEKETTGEITVLSGEQEAWLSRVNATEEYFEDLPVSRLFEKHAALDPDRIAVTGTAETLTYRELNDRANRLASLLAGLSVRKEEMVGMLLPRIADLCTAELGILKAGCAFLPLLPEYPDERIRYCLKDSGSRIVVTTETIRWERKDLFTGDSGFIALTVEEIAAAAPSDNPAETPAPENLAYCIYTSGSTGNPKGVMIEHHGLSNFVQTFATARGMNEWSAERELAMASVSFDMHIAEILLPLSNGKTVVIASEEEIHNPADFAALLSGKEVDAMTCTPSFLTNMLGFAPFEAGLRRMKMIMVGAEVFPKELFESLKKISPDLHVYNGYGPSECTVSSSSKLITDSQSITIGGPAANYEYLIMDEESRVLPPYALGELVILGTGVGRGYVNLPEKTAAAFFTFDGKKAYHSGDLARFNADGEIEFGGRLDNQVKLRGFRVELDEIEKTILGYPGVKQAKVIVRNNGTEDYLAGFFTAMEPVEISGLTAYLKSKLTYYMVPDLLMELPEMPLTPSGKIDKKALPEGKKERKKKSRKAPKKSLEQKLCELFASVLSLGEYYADDGFFEMGGTSLSASKVVMQLMAEGIEVQYQDIFDHPTPEELAEFIEGKNKKETASEETRDDSPVKSVYPEQLKYNSLEYAAELTREPLGDVVLTGAVGFLGIHILRELLETEEGHIYCLVRRGSFQTPERRLRGMLIYYFDDPLDELVEKRVTVLEADVTDNVTEVLRDIPFDTIINCAACVKHYAADDILERINVGGVENLIQAAMEKNARMIQISTVSIPGVHTEETFRMRVKMYEDRLFVIDDMGNKYSISKYHAELKMLEAVKNGLRGKIIRVGNLMGRHKDGEFQINFNTNAFLNALRGFAAIGKSPISHATDVMSFSPIDMTAKAVVLLAGTNDMFTAFCADSRFLFDEWQLIEAANHVGIKITPVPDREYYDDYHRMLADPKINEKLRGLMTNDRPDLHGVESDNTFTVNILYRLGFSWPLPDLSYLERALESLMTLDYFEEED